MFPTRILGRQVQRALIRERTRVRNASTLFVSSKQGANTSSTLLLAGSAIFVLGTFGNRKNDQHNTNCDFAHSSFQLKDLYHLQEVLGEGTFGKVYRATRRGDRSSVAIKAMEPQMAQHEIYERERAALTILSEPGHSNVCMLYDQHQDRDGCCYLAMDLIDGGEVYEHLVKKASYSEEEASKLVKQLAEALQYIHSKGLVHGDLKLENLMMDSWDSKEAQLKVVDFGCTVQAHDESDYSKQLACFAKTIAYSPPEVLQSIGKHTITQTPAIDMFAVGCIIYCMLTGTHPFDPTGKATDAEIAEIICRTAKEDEFLDEFVFSADRTAGLSQSAIDMMKRLLSPNPMNRMTTEEFCNHPWVLKSV